MVALGTAAQSHQAVPATARILGTGNYLGWHPPAGNPRHSKPSKNKNWAEQGSSRGAHLPAGLCLSGKLSETLRMCPNRPDLSLKPSQRGTGPWLPGSLCRGFAPGPLIKPYQYYSVHNIILLLTCPPILPPICPQTFCPSDTPSTGQLCPSLISIFHCTVCDSHWDNLLLERPEFPLLPHPALLPAPQEGSSDKRQWAQRA